MASEVRAFVECAKPFLERASASTMEGVATALESACSRATSDADSRIFKWGTPAGDLGRPIYTIDSEVYKGAIQGTGHKPVHAQLAFEWICNFDPGSRRVFVDDGWISVELVKSAGATVKVVHYDVCRGGSIDSAAHPPVHVQFHGALNDLPRLPTFLVHPVDVLDLFLHELFQSQWRAHLTSTRARHALRGYPKLQRQRFARYFSRYDLLLKSDEHSAFGWLQAPLRVPLELHNT